MSTTPRIPANEQECVDLIGAVLMNDLAHLAGKGKAEDAIACIQNDKEHFETMLKFVKDFRKEIFAQEKELKKDDPDYAKKLGRISIIKQISGEFKTNMKKLRNNVSG